MSRSQPSNRIPNPSERWLEWNGQNGHFVYYDKDAQARRSVLFPFTFWWLDEMKAIGGFDSKGKSRIYSNEIRDTQTDAFIVKSFNSGTLAEGLYKDIKKDVEANDGYYVASVYIAFKRENSDSFMLGNIRFKRAALAAWLDFTKKHGKEIEEKAVTVTGYTEATTGRVTYRVPKFEVTETTAATQSAALALDGELQAYLTAYLKRTVAERADVERDVPQDITAADIPF